MVKIGNPTDGNIDRDCYKGLQAFAYGGMGFKVLGQYDTGSGASGWCEMGFEASG